MRFSASFLDRASQAIRRRPTISKLIVICALSSGGVLAYADAKSNHDFETSELTRKKKLVVLGTGWAGTSFLRNLDASQYDVQVVSPRNYFLFTPLLPSVTCGTVEPRSIVEPIRKIMHKKGGGIKFWEAECYKIDPTNKKVLCCSNIWTNMDGSGEFAVDYDYLVIALGAKPNTFNTPGVVENCHFLKVYFYLLYRIPGHSTVRFNFIIS